MARTAGGNGLAVTFVDKRGEQAIFRFNIDHGQAVDGSMSFIDGELLFSVGVVRIRWTSWNRPFKISPVACWSRKVKPTHRLRVFAK